MKQGLHPDNYRPVVIKDSNSGFAFLTKSTAKTGETIKWEDGQEYPLLTVHISSASHPFFTGEERIVDVEGRVDRFKARQAAAESQRGRLANKAKKSAVQAANKPTVSATKLGDAKAQNKKPTKSDK
ncbi:MAG TPA: type B 50S ribosomal protein L31 [Candidatus Saccharimonadales bacterium]